MDEVMRWMLNIHLSSFTYSESVAYTDGKGYNAGITYKQGGKMARKRGMSEGAQLPHESSRFALAGALHQAQHRVVDVDPKAVAGNPENPVSRMETGIAELASSIQQQGLIQPLTVCTLQAYVSANPQYVDQFDATIEYVVLDGDRRRTAAVESGQEVIPVIIRDDLAGDPDGVRLATALQRLPLTPVQEAHAYQRKVDKGLTHAKIAAAAGVSQGQVTKRLALLRLPTSIQVAIEAGVYPVIDGLTLLKEGDAVVQCAGTLVAEAIEDGRLLLTLGQDVEGDDAEQRAALRRSVPMNLELSRLLYKARNDVAREEAEAEAERVAQEWGVRRVEAAEEFKHPYEHRVEDEAEAKKLAAEGNLVVSSDPYAGDRVAFYRVAPLEKPRSTYQEQEKARVKALRDAGKARAPFVEALLGKKPSLAQLRTAVVGLAYGVVDANARKPAMKRWSELHPDQDALSYYQIDDVPEADQVQVSWWTYIYAMEASLRNAYSPPGLREVRYLRELVAVGYRPTRDEAKAIKKFDQQATKEDQ